MGTTSTLLARAPGQVGGPAWRGPRVGLYTRLEPTLASLVKQAAEAEGLSASEFIRVTLVRVLADVE